MASKIFNRIFFTYFICYKGIITFKDGGSISGENLFRILLENGDFVENLRSLFHRFNSVENRFLKIGEYSIKIPYLNGGLFRPERLEAGLFFTLKTQHWRQLFDFLNTYRWIIEEDIKTAIEDEGRVLTPEILGHVYERSVVEWEIVGFEEEARNAIATISERKKKGVYYTPQEITENIVSNTVSPHILRLFSGKYVNLNNLLEKATRKELEKLLDILSSLRLLDPACGSGAFLIQASEFVFQLRTRVLHKLNLKPDYYKLKLETITENIYGVDILEGAIEIAKLRLWLWLVSEYEEGLEIHSLPNIEYNLRVGNSLLGWTDEEVHYPSIRTPLTEEIEKIFLGLITYSNDVEGKTFEQAKLLLSSYNLGKYIQAYNLLYQVYRRTHGLEARNLKDILEKVRDALYTSVDPAFVNYINKELNQNHKNGKPLKAILDIDEYKFFKPFHWTIDFGHIIANGGFDVVIGNPPYGNAIPKEQRTLLSKLLTTLDGNDGSYNSASVFIERAKRYLKKEGLLGFIVPNSITRVKEFGKIRNFLFDEFSLLEIVDEASPFPDVTLEMITVFCSNNGGKKNYSFKVTSNRQNAPFKINCLKTEDCRMFNRIILYQDSIWDFIASRSTFGLLDGTRGITISQEYLSQNKDKKHEIPVLVSGKAVNRYCLVEDEFMWGKKGLLRSAKAEEIFESEDILSTRLSHSYRVATKPPGIVAADNVIRLFPKENVDKKFLILALNSSLMKFVVPRYLLNLIDLTMFINSVTDSTPLRLPKDAQTYNKLSCILLFLHEYVTCQENSDQVLDQQISFFELLADYLVYELYLDESEEQNLLFSISEKIEAIEYDEWIKLRFKQDPSPADLRQKNKFESQALEKICEMYRIMSKNNRIQNRIDELKTQKWIKLIEGH